MPQFTKGIKVNYDAGRGLWYIRCHVKGLRWRHAADPDKAKIISIAQDLARRLLAKEDIRPAKFRQAAPTDVIPGTVRDVGDQWLVAHAKNTTNNTAEAYDNALRSHIYPILGDVAMTSDALTRDRCKAFAQALIGRPAGRRTIEVNGKRVPKPLAFASREFTCYVLGILCEWALEKNLLHTNPAKRLGKWTLDKHELDRPTIAWTHDQAAALLKAAKAWAEDWYLPLKFALKTGVRSAELVEVRWTDQTLRPLRDAAGKIAIAQQYLNRPRNQWTLEADGHRVKTLATDASRISPLKGRRARAVDVWADLWAELEAHGKAEREKFLKLGRPQDVNLELLFTNARGERLDPKYFARHVLPMLCRKAGIPVSSSIHATRHTFATVLLTAGERLRYVSEQLGHKNESLTELTYKHWIPDHQFDVQRGQRVAAAWGSKA